MPRQKSQHLPPDRDSELWKLNVHLTRFVNVVFGRKLRPSLALYDAIVSAESAGYTHDDMRLAYWVARCIVGDGWLKSTLQAMGDNALSPDILLRHHGGINPKTGQPAKRWLDELVSRASETNPMLVGSVLGRLPEDMIEGERELLRRNEVPFEER